MLAHLQRANPPAWHPCLHDARIYNYIRARVYASASCAFKIIFYTDYCQRGRGTSQVARICSPTRPNPYDYGFGGKENFVTREKILLPYLARSNQHSWWYIPGIPLAIRIRVFLTRIASGKMLQWRDVHQGRLQTLPRVTSKRVNRDVCPWKQWGNRWFTVINATKRFDAHPGYL